MYRFSMVIVLALACVLGAGSAGATLVGDEVRVDWRFSTFESVFMTDTFTVQEGVGDTSFFDGNNTHFIDIEASTIRFNMEGPATHWTVGAYNGFWFGDLDWTDGPGEIVGVSIESSYVGLDLSRVDFGADWVAINMQGLDIIPDENFVLLTLDTIHGPVPEPATMTLLGLGLTGFALRRKKMA